MQPLQGKVAIVTGAAGGQGQAEVSAFATAGAFVLATDIRDEAPVAFAEFGDKVVYRRHDVSSEEVWRSVVEDCLDRWGRVDILINNAGIYRPASMMETSQALLDQHFAVNVRGVMLGMQAVAMPMMKAHRGSIINIASGAGSKGTSGIFAYSTSKWAVRGMTRSAARELAAFNIRVNAILPGLIDTAMISGRVSKEDMIERVPLARVGTPEEVARMALFLAVEAQSYITGSEFTIDGGYNA
ncbi:SDR family NAD(P)-dependent oxidoreductase [Neorhizobium sp. DT-125]|uniref:SDR family NAD(P)-dependent oxidoreductase n=1 Tax=Neorhizobium sp. DT-125 TaxID=3396163 RepID=UPI003F1DA6E7